MTTDIRKLNDGDFEPLRRIKNFAFLVDRDYYDDPERRERFLDYMGHTSGCFVDGELVAAGAMLPFSMYRGGASTTVAGLAGVVSAGAHRRRGYVRRLLFHLLEQQRAEGAGWCLEYPFAQRYYAKFGWRTISNGVFVEAPSDAFPVTGGVDGARRLELRGDEDRELLREIYGQWACQFNFTMSRDGAVRRDWDNLLIGRPHQPGYGQRFAFAVGEGAYCVLWVRREEGDEIARVLDWAYTDPESRRSLLQLWGSLSGQIAQFELQIPDGDPLAWPLSPHIAANPGPIQARIIDVPSALSGVRCANSMDAAVAVRDEFCPWNDATFRLFTDGEKLRVELTDREPDVTLGIGALAMLASGTPVAPHRGGLVDGDVDVARSLSGLADRPAYMPLCDYF